ncbi:MAG: hypothetical protein CVV37_04090 [Nitrospira bacterium HGW-Nitrospira-1]|nr:MAG: hypothetical protein CVV37_04090 [Nitrospira bacterium HGW-Nitrospira-1]
MIKRPNLHLCIDRQKVAGWENQVSPYIGGLLLTPAFVSAAFLFILSGCSNDSSRPDAAYEPPPLVETCPTCPKTVRQMLYDQVEDILTKLDNTGYSHRPFVLHPDYTELKNQTESTPIKSYDLFLDCSGFVGYYVLQGIAQPLYDQIPRCYSSCPSKSSDRPLAADFVDYFDELIAKFGGKEATSPDNACWGKVEYIKDALPGDVIAYLHEDNLDDKTAYCCYREGTKFITTSEKNKAECDVLPDGHIMYKAKLKDPDCDPCEQKCATYNTGHVLFIHALPYRSKEMKDNNDKYQWVVEVADSTNNPHANDSRKEGEDKSVYGSNTYHAWMVGKEGYVQRCQDGSYHRDCSVYGTSQDPDIKNIEIDAPKNDKHPYGYHPTGVGAGKMYVNDSMDGYRVKKEQDSPTAAKVVIGRPVPCKE